MRIFSQWTRAANEQHANGAAVVAGALLVAFAAVGIPAAAVWAGSGLVAHAPTPVLYVSMD